MTFGSHNGMTCLTCRFQSGHVCNRFPPTVLWTGMTVIIRRPEVLDADWCGEWKLHDRYGDETKEVVPPEKGTVGRSNIFNDDQIPYGQPKATTAPKKR